MTELEPYIQPEFHGFCRQRRISEVLGEYVGVLLRNFSSMEKVEALESQMVYTCCDAVGEDG